MAQSPKEVLLAEANNYDRLADTHRSRKLYDDPAYRQLKGYAQLLREMAAETERSSAS